MNPHELNRLLKQSLLLPVLLLLGLAAVLLVEVRATIRASVFEQQSDQTITGLDGLLTLIVDQETGLRGYQATANPAFLEPYRIAAPQTGQAFDRLNSGFADRPDQQEELAATRSEYEQWSGYASRVLSLVSKHEDSSSAELNFEGKRHMDSVRAHFASMIDRAARRRDERASRLRKQVYRIVATTVGLTAFLGLLLGWLTRSQLHRVSAAYGELLRAAQQRAEQLYESRQSYYTTLQSIGDGVIVCDGDGRVNFMNQVAQDLCGMTLENATAAPLTTVFNIVNETTRLMVENPVDKVRRLNTVVGLANHTVLLRPDGTEINIDDSGAPIRDQQGNLTGIVLVFRDITEQRKTAQALLANEKLAVAGRLSATIAHEIHNPLDSVANLLYLLRNHPTAENTQRYLDLAMQELSRVTQISRTMLSLYREAKAPVPIDLKDLLESVLILVDRKLIDAGIKLVQEMPEAIRVEGFPAELRQVFTNLIANAAEASDAGSGITIRLRASDAEDGAIVEISDLGPGIPEDVQTKLFAPFFTTKGESGTGLGLWVSRGIVKKHGGSLEVISSTDAGEHGTTMRVFLPAKSQAALTLAAD